MNGEKSSNIPTDGAIGRELLLALCCRDAFFATSCDCNSLIELDPCHPTEPKTNASTVNVNLSSALHEAVLNYEVVLNYFENDGIY